MDTSSWLGTYLSTGTTLPLPTRLSFTGSEESGWSLKLLIQLHLEL